MPLTSAQINERGRIHARFAKLLSDAQKERNRRNTLVADPYDTIDNPAWVLHERQVMFDAVNAERSARGLPVVDMKEVVRVERSASGHSDYTRKFALYCMELVCGA